MRTQATDVAHWPGISRGGVARACTVCEIHTNIYIYWWIYFELNTFRWLSLDARRLPFGSGPLGVSEIGPEAEGSQQSVEMEEQLLILARLK